MRSLTQLLASLALLGLAACSECAPNCRQETTLSPPASDINAFGIPYSVPPAPKPKPPVSSSQQ